MREKKSLNRFVVADQSKCIGCRLCEMACAMAHTPGGRPRTVGSLANPVQPRLHLMLQPGGCVPVQCRHCEDAPCANACQVSAIVQKNGTIFVDGDRCMGCKTCMLACPFGAMDLVPVFKHGLPVAQGFSREGEGAEEEGFKQRYVASKCDLCMEAGEPACVAVCPRKALTIIVPQEHRARRMRDAALGLATVAKNYVA